jgi:hypothetical protein
VNEIRVVCLGVVLLAAVLLAGGCAGSGKGFPAQDVSPAASVKSYYDYPDHVFDAGEYIQGMEKGGHNLLVWQDPGVDLTAHRSVAVRDFDGRLLPVQDVFSYEPFIKAFNSSLKNSLKLPQGGGPSALRIEGGVVECNPGSRAARAWVGFGAGKAAGAVACEVFEPGSSRPCLRIYARDTGSMGAWGGDSVAMLNHILNEISFRVATVLEARIGTR